MIREVMGFPVLSHRTWILVLKPPRLRPSASVSGSPLLHQLHADARGRSSRQRSGSPNPPRPLDCPARAGHRGSSARSLPAVTDGTGCILCSTVIVQARDQVAFGFRSRRKHPHRLVALLMIGPPLGGFTNYPDQNKIRRRKYD